MSFQNAKIGMHAGSGGGGGFVVINDSTSTKGQIRDSDYFQASVKNALTGSPKRTYEALVDFILKQQSGDDGVPFSPIGSDGGGNIGVLTANASTRIITYAAGS